MHDDHKVYIIFFPFLILVFDSFIWNWLQYVALRIGHGLTSYKSLIHVHEANTKWGLGLPIAPELIRQKSP